MTIKREHRITLYPGRGYEEPSASLPVLLRDHKLENVQDSTETILQSSFLTTILEAPEGLLSRQLKTMHLALPARKSSNPPPYATQSTRFPMLRRSRVQTIVLCACAVGAVIFVLSQVLGGSEKIPLGTPPVVIVTVLDPENYSKDYINNIKENRIEYAKKHGKALW